MDSTRKNPSGTVPKRPAFVKAITYRKEITLRPTLAQTEHWVRERRPLPLSRPAFIAALLVMVSDLPRPMPTAQWNSMTTHERMYYLHHHNVSIRDLNSRIVDSMTHIEFDRIAPVGHVIRLDKKGNRYV